MMAQQNTKEGAMTTLIRGLVVFAALAAPVSLHAQSYPDHPIKMIVPFAAGGPTDVIGRVIAQKLGESWSQQIVVENIAGAGGNIGLAAALRSPPDGYTIVVVSTGFIVNPSLYAKVPYGIRDFAPVSLVAASPNVLSVNPAVPARTVPELIALVKANPGRFSYAQPGIGSTPHLAAELFKLRFGLDLAMVPFGSAAPAVTSTIGGHTPVAFTALPPAMANIQDGTLRGLAVLAHKRNPGVPDVPTMAEAGIPDQESDTVTGIVARAGTPKDIIDSWQREIARVVALPEVNGRLRVLGFDPVASTPEAFAERIRTEAARWEKVAKDANIRID
jgi:tripartite-type tricarboxylate transporter receptor subunit TctC